jgi:hypothetical protein
MSEQDSLVLVAVDGTSLGAATVEGGVDVRFPIEGVRWTWVLDARHSPYAELPKAQVLERAARNRKKYVLMGADQAKASADQG